MPHRLLPLAGSQIGNYGHVDAPIGLDARFNNPYDCELSKDRNYLYVSDTGNSVIRRITLNGSYPVETFCPAVNANRIYVNQATGNLWFFTHDYTGSYQEQLHHINKVTPSGNVSIAQTLVGQSPVDCLPDRNERFVRVKMGVEAFGLQPYWWNWYMVDIAAGSNPRLIYEDDRLAGPTGQMWSERHPSTAIFLTRYRDGWQTRAAIQRAEEHGAPFSYEVIQGGSYPKIVNGIPEGPNETLVCVSGYMWKARYNADAAAPYMEPGKVDPEFGLPMMPAVTLARDPIADTYYFPMNGGVNQAGLTYNIPINTVSVGVPNSQLSVIVHTLPDNPGDV